MAVAAGINISGGKTGLPSGSVTITVPQIVNSASTGQISDVALSAGANTITVPSSTAIGVIIVPVAGNTVSLTLKGVTGDTGVPLHLTNPTVYSFPAGTTNFVITAGTGGTSAELNWF